MPTTRDELLAQLAKERYLPTLPPPPTVHQKARQARRTKPAGKPKRRDTGTGWPA